MAIIVTKVTFSENVIIAAKGQQTLGLRDTGVRSMALLCFLSFTTNGVTSGCLVASLVHFTLSELDFKWGSREKATRWIKLHIECVQVLTITIEDM